MEGEEGLLLQGVEKERLKKKKGPPWERGRGRIKGGKSTKKKENDRREGDVKSWKKKTRSFLANARKKGISTGCLFKQSCERDREVRETRFVQTNGANRFKGKKKRVTDWARTT